MGRRQRINFSLPPDVVERLDEIPSGQRSGEVESALREYYDDL